MLSAYSALSTLETTCRILCLRIPPGYLNNGFALCVSEHKRPTADQALTPFRRRVAVGIGVFTTSQILSSILHRTVLKSSIYPLCSLLGEDQRSLRHLSSAISPSPFEQSQDLYDIFLSYFHNHEVTRLSFLSPFVFEKDLNPVIHAPYLPDIPQPNHPDELAQLPSEVNAITSPSLRNSDDVSEPDSSTQTSPQAIVTGSDATYNQSSPSSPSGSSNQLAIISCTISNCGKSFSRTCERK
jgi:hypothetical protein